MAFLRRIKRELEEAEFEPIKGVQLTMLGEDYHNLRGWIIGPEGSVYEGGVFEMEIKLPQDYPFKPPIIKFVTKVYHPNVN